MSGIIGSASICASRLISCFFRRRLYAHTPTIARTTNAASIDPDTMAMTSVCFFLSSFFCLDSAALLRPGAGDIVVVFPAFVVLFFLGTGRRVVVVVRYVVTFVEDVFEGLVTATGGAAVEEETIGGSDEPAAGALGVTFGEVLFPITRGGKSSIFGTAVANLLLLPTCF